MASVFTIKGFERAGRALRSIGKSIKDEAARALYEEALIEMTESMRRTPVDTGALRASHSISGPFFRSDAVEVAIRVGGVAAPYAVIVHEDLDMFHPNGGQAKFLESTVMESAPFLPTRVARRIKINRGGL